MVEYIKVLDFIKKTGKNRSSVYRDITRGKIKTTKLNGVTHIIIENEGTSNFSKETIETKNETGETSYKDAEIIDDTPGSKYDIEVFKASLITLEDFALRIENAKDETIARLDEIIERQNKQIENLNETIKIISQDNNELRKQLAVRETELVLNEKRIEEIETKLKHAETELETHKKNTITEENTLQKTNAFWRPKL